MNILKLLNFFSGYLIFISLANSQITNGGWITGVVPLASSSQVPGYNGDFRTVSDEGLTETAPGNGVYQLASSQVGWTSQGGDYYGAIQFDLGSVKTINRFRVWNYNEVNYSFRGFKNTTVQYSNNAVSWKTTPQKFLFSRAPETNNYLGEQYSLTWPITARYVRLWCDAPWGGVEQCGLSKVRFYEGVVTGNPPIASSIWPADAGIVNVKEAPYFAVGDGIVDDYNAIQSAIRDHEGTSGMIYLPAGTYRVSQPLRCRNNNDPVGVQRNGLTFIRGQSRDLTTIRLDDGVLTNVSQSAHLLYSGYQRFNDGSGNSADWFHITITDLTLNTGSNNPGAKGLAFYSNNVGIVRDVDIRSADGQGLIGLDCGYVGQNGPNTVKNVRVYGFDTGILTSDAVNSQTLEDIELYNQNVVGLLNNAQVLSIRNLKTSGSVVGVRSNADFAFVTIIDSIFNGVGVASGFNAIENEGIIFARNVSSTGFAKTLVNTNSSPVEQFTGTLKEYVRYGNLSLFPSESSSLNLPVEDTPLLVDDIPNGSNWANVRNYRITSELDIALAAQRAIDSGATTVYFPLGRYSLRSPIILRGAVRHLALFFSSFVKDSASAEIQLGAGIPPVVTVDNHRSSFTGSIPIRISADRGLSCRNTDNLSWISKTHRGKFYIENCVGDEADIGVGSKLWARGFNVESNYGVFDPEIAAGCSNAGGKMWMLGLKNEGKKTLIKVTNGGETELIGGLNYSSAGSFPGVPAMRVIDSRVSFVQAEVNFGGNSFNPVIIETREGVVRTLTDGQVPRAVGGYRLPLYSSKRPLLKASFQSTGLQKQISWNSIPSRVYSVERSIDLINWQPISGSSSTATVSQYLMSFTENNTSKRAFYRAVLLDAP
jgi:Pectate lyase superfamily protein/F5/8 type C domain